MKSSPLRRALCLTSCVVKPYRESTLPIFRPHSQRTIHVAVAKLQTAVDSIGYFVVQTCQMIVDVAEWTQFLAFPNGTRCSIYEGRSKIRSTSL